MSKGNETRIAKSPINLPRKIVSGDIAASNVDRLCNISSLLGVLILCLLK
jgi:hypothetical protein